ncbi:MAG: acetyl-CoA carboxylase carboxyltransferase subunit beta [Saprospiraceae bacterium]|jgi:acetyl-CoA carboxylase carboxyl transferase subunit beta|nr:acetyl-CoA carboxylase carboxyltransferase subunit beta [Saprospiraceae bacterium]MDB9891804.1 acetyl-CoA carboxylase, carboxyltransferase subunit beta [bacterium]MDA9299703.1 acetyl-CoA carboxylase, carboxyltransferase subunit beta [Saprospiraceae bacterium]MDB9914474.1 acetyl-CoA carboxylase, carboxyltransferase subunit beta [Saprospiraceae bacterium]MDC1309190.1 acetyl-CoA carboxylase, carboxyltransferase subunit beta [Saprospiraceae bacterium]
MGWFKRLKDGIQTATKNKKEAPDGLWNKCKSCAEMTTMKELRENFFICPKCDYHSRIGSNDYFEMIFDGKYTELFDNLLAKDMLKFSDLKSYEDRLSVAYKKFGEIDAMKVAEGKVGRKPLVIAAMDFSFIGGSMGSVVGEKIARACDYCIENKIPLMIISKSGGARMMEAAYSLMQMAKTSAKLAALARAGVPYFSFMTDPTTGGVTASYAMLGDINFSEPGALIGFAGPRVIKETIKRDLPEGFQRSEFLLDHGFLDFIVHRSNLKERIDEMLTLFKMEEKVS